MNTTTVPRATYRLQLNKDFRFADAQKLAPYLQSLGISHAYLSPILKARAGSSHGYDCVDHAQINPEIGTLDEFRALAQTLRQHGIGIVLDIVPNHMGVGGADNPHWLDMLEWGRASHRPHWFDINWTPSEPGLAGKVLVPFLGTSYDRALNDGQLELRFDPDRGELAVWAHDSHKLPLAPWTYPDLLKPLGTDFAEACAVFEAAAPDAGDRYQKADEGKRLLAEAAKKNGALAEHIARLNSGSRDHLNDHIDGQNWRIARFSTGADDINYRRFFIVSDLAGIRIENEDVFDVAHALIFQLVDEGLVQGLRIDHIDGLADPKAYCLALRQKCPRPIYLTVEKILADHEFLRPDWQVDGTTGYEFMTLASALLSDPEGEKPMSAAYAAFTGNDTPFDTLEHVAKLEILDREMAAELDALAERACALTRTDRRYRDLTYNGLRNGLREVIARMAVYRTYADADGANADDIAEIDAAFARAEEGARWLDPDIFAYLKAIMARSFGGADALDLARRIQQLTGPTMAKGLEDTALYRHNRLVALNDVGQKPDRFSLTPEAFHAFNAERAKNLPRSMLGTSSHDTKRGEDTRMRLLALSGMPDIWAREVGLWRTRLGDVAAPVHPDDLWLFFQLLLGAWPMHWAEGDALDPSDLADLGERLKGAMTKSLREARLRSLWSAPDEGYEAAVVSLIDTVLDPSGPVLADFRAFAEPVAGFGAANSLILTTLKLTAPGVPDIYQGADLWEQSLVDPDNRRPVDFALRQTLLDASGENWRRGEQKQKLIANLLGMRKADPDLLVSGSYEPLPAGDETVLAFRRRHGDHSLVVAVSLYPWRQAPADFALPPELTGENWFDVLAGEPAVPPRPFAGRPCLVLTNFKPEPA